MKETQPLGLEGGPRGQLIPVPLHGDAAPARPAPHTPAESAPAFAFRQAPSTRGARGRVSGLPANRVANRPGRPETPRGRGRGGLSPLGRHREPEGRLTPCPASVIYSRTDWTPRSQDIALGKQDLRPRPLAGTLSNWDFADWQLHAVAASSVPLPLPLLPFGVGKVPAKPPLFSPPESKPLGKELALTMAPTGLESVITKYYKTVQLFITMFCLFSA